MKPFTQELSVFSEITLDSIKEISATKNYLQLPFNKRKCGVKKYEDCRVDLYIDHCKDQCHCVPFGEGFLMKQTGVQAFCSSSGYNCCKNVSSIDFKQCPVSCEGLFADTSLSTQMTSSDKNIVKINEEYKEFKKQYDNIKRDIRNTLETQLGLIGGTFGLFTVFSLLSGVEVVYFLGKFIFWKVIMKLHPLKYQDHSLPTKI